MKSKKIFYIIAILLFSGCRKNEITVPAINKTYYTISQNELSRAIENGTLPNDLAVLTVYDAEGEMPDLSYFKHLITLNILTRRKVDKIIIGKYQNDTCEYIFINNGIDESGARGRKYGDIENLELLPYFTKLKSITIYNSEIARISIPDQILSIEKLYVKGGSNITDTSFLRNLPNLIDLHLDLSDINAVLFKLASNLRLSNISIKGNIQSLEGLDSCPKLHGISLLGNYNISNIINEIPSNITELSLIDCGDILVSIVEMMPETVREIGLFGDDILFRDEDIKDYGDREINFEGENAKKYFKKFIKTDDEHYMVLGVESFMVGQTKYTIIMPPED